jgi:hypothetical protein
MRASETFSKRSTMRRTEFVVMRQPSATITELEKVLKIKVVADALLVRFIRDRTAALRPIGGQPPRD